MKEDKSSWVSFFQWLRGRGLEGVRLIVGDKYLGMTKLMEAINRYSLVEAVFCKLLKASCKEIAISEIMDCIEKILIDTGRQIMVKWCME